MSSITGISSITGLTTIQNLGAGSDVTPNAVNWIDIPYDGIIGFFQYTERQITGINQTITLRVTNTSSSDGIYYLVSSTQGVIVNGDESILADPGSLGMSYLPHNSTFTVSNNQYVTFGGSSNTTNFTNTVTNVSDGDAVLDTFEYTCVNC